MKRYPQSFLAVFLFSPPFFIFSFIFELFLALRNTYILSFNHCALLTGEIQKLFLSSGLFNGLWNIFKKKIFKMSYLDVCLILQTLIIISIHGFITSIIEFNLIQGEHKVFPWLQTFITRKLLYVEYKHIFFQTVAQEVFLQHLSTLQHVLLLLHGKRLIDNQFLSTRSPTCLQLL